MAVAGEVLGYLEKVQRASPSIRVSVVCSHSYSTGKRSSRTVVTYRGCTPFKVARAEDVTKLERNWTEAYGGLDGTVAIGDSTPFMVASRLVWRVGDDETSDALRDLKRQLHRQNKHRDRLIEVTTSCELGELVEYQLCVPPGTTVDRDRDLVPGCLDFLLCLLCPMWASLRLWWATRNVAGLISHTTYKTVHVSSRQGV